VRSPVSDIGRTVLSRRAPRQPRSRGDVTSLERGSQRSGWSCASRASATRERTPSLR
jgi:hypothetical protein